MSAGTATAITTPMIAITVQERSPPAFRSAVASLNRPESIGTPASNERLEANRQDAGTVERPLRR